MTKIHQLFKLVPDNTIGKYIENILSLPDTLDIYDSTQVTGVLEARQLPFGYQFQYNNDGTVQHAMGNAYVKYESLELNPNPVVIRDTTPETIAKALAYALLDLLLEARHKLEAGYMTQDEYDTMIGIKQV